MIDHLYIVILAGGEGIRFAPLSTPDRPKQFLNITSPDFSMIQDACQRLGIKPVHAYRKTKDIRTLMELADTHAADDAVNPNAHDALTDCIYQVGYCVKAFNILKK